MKMIVYTEVEFDAAHKLGSDDLGDQELYGECSRMHGHRYKLKVGVSELKHCRNVIATGMVINFKELKNLLKEHVIKKYDHKYLNDVLLELKNITTAENMIIIIWQELQPLLKELHLDLRYLGLWETPTSYVELINNEETK